MQVMTCGLVDFATDPNVCLCVQAMTCGLVTFATDQDAVLLKGRKGSTLTRGKSH